MTRRIAIIGAGMAGLSAARRLKGSGFAVTMFDKGRGLGGRMATRRSADEQGASIHFDHGAQYFTARGERFGALVRDWVEAGLAAPWGDRDGFVGVPAMTAPVRDLAKDHEIVMACQVVRLHRGAAGWTVGTAEGAVDTPGNGTFAAAVLAIPAPQAIPLAGSAGIDLPGLADAVYAPCWAMMAAFDNRLPMSADNLRPTDEMIAWIARNASKPGRDPAREAIVVHATPAWSRAHLEDQAATVASALLDRFRTIASTDAEPSHVVAHRWRYAFVERALGLPCLWNEQVGLGACGDWCIGPRVEAAFDSGEAMADRIIAGLGRTDGV